MDLRIRGIVSLAIALLIFPEIMKAPVVFKPTDKTKYVAPGEEELSGTAKQLFEVGQAAENRGNLKRAISAYKSLVRHHPKDALAPGALYRAAELQEKLHGYTPAAESYRLLVERYPTSPHFDDAIEGQFRIGELFLSGAKLKFLGIKWATSLDRAVEIFAAVVRTAPYGKYTARAQFDIGLAREKQGAPDSALQAYQAVVDKFPNQPAAIDAQYQIGYIWLVAARHGTKDQAATTNAKTAFQDFLFRYPNSEKAAQARANLKLLEGKQTSTSMQVAQFYDKQKNYRAAVIYYNEVIRQQPGSKESDQAKKRIDHLRAKFGDAKLQPGFAAAEAKKNKEAGTAEHRENAPEHPSGQQPVSRPEQAASGGGLPAKESPTPSAAGSPPALPPATDLALPPVSLDPGRRGAGEDSSAPAALPTPEASATPVSGLLMP